MANPKGQYMVDANEASTSNFVQLHAITTLRSRKVVDNKVQEKRDECWDLCKRKSKLKNFLFIQRNKNDPQDLLP
jgi:hypothetical protein